LPVCYSITSSARSKIDCGTVRPSALAVLTVREPRLAMMPTATQSTQKRGRAARRNDLNYHLAFPAALLRDAALRALGGERLIARYDWLFEWAS